MNDLTNHRPHPTTRGHTVPNAGHPLIRLVIALIIYAGCVFMLHRYGNAAIILFAQKTGTTFTTPYAASSLELLGVFIVMLIVCLIIRQFHVFFKRRRSFLYGIFVGGYMFLYSVIGFISILPGTESFQDRDTILFSILYFILVGLTEELVFRGITADLLLQAFFKTNPGRKPVIPAVIISGVIFSLAHATNLKSADASGVIVQMAGAFVLGMFLTAVYFRSGNIYTVIFLHILNDIVAALPVTILKSDISINDIISGYEAADLTMLIPYIIVLIFLLRPKKLEEIRTL